MSNSTLRAPLSGHAPTDRGTLTHTLVTTHVPLLAKGHSAQSLVEPMATMADLLLAGNRNRRAAVKSSAVSLAHRYLTKFAVSATNGWHLLGVEFETGHGPVDVAWQHEPNGAVMFDEIKTSGSAQWAQPEWIYQIARYNLGGLEQFGDLFIGTRLLPLARMDIAEWFPQFYGPEGYKIAPTVSDPLRPATEASPEVETGGR